MSKVSFKITGELIIGDPGKKPIILDINSNISKDNPQLVFELKEGTQADLPALVSGVLGKSVAEVMPALALDQLKLTIGKAAPPTPNDLPKGNTGVAISIHSSITDGHPVKFSATDKTNSNLQLGKPDSKLTATDDNPHCFTFDYTSHPKTCKIDLNAKGAYSEDFEFTKISLAYNYGGSKGEASSANWDIHGEVKATAYQSDEIDLSFDYVKDDHHRKFKFGFSDIGQHSPLKTDNFKMEKLDVLVDLVNKKK